MALAKKEYKKYEKSHGTTSLASKSLSVNPSHTVVPKVLLCEQRKRHVLILYFSSESNEHCKCKILELWYTLKLGTAMSLIFLSLVTQKLMDLFRVCFLHLNYF